MARHKKQHQGRIGKNAGRVPLRMWQKSLLLDMEFGTDCKFQEQVGDVIYINTSHPAYKRWFVQFVRSAAMAHDKLMEKLKSGDLSSKSS